MIIFFNYKLIDCFRAYSWYLWMWRM